MRLSVIFRDSGLSGGAVGDMGLLSRTGASDLIFRASAVSGRLGALRGMPVPLMATSPAGSCCRESFSAGAGRGPKLSAS